MCQLKRWVWICSLELKDLGKPCNSLHIVQFNLPRKTNTTCFSLTTLQFLYSRKHLSRKSRCSPIQLPTSAFNIISSFQYNLLYPVHLQPSPFYPTSSVSTFPANKLSVQCCHRRSVCVDIAMNDESQREFPVSSPWRCCHPTSSLLSSGERERGLRILISNCGTPSWLKRIGTTEGIRYSDQLSDVDCSDTKHNAELDTVVSNRINESALYQ